MKADILKIAGVKNEKEFYKLYPTQESFMAKHGAAFKKLQKAQAGYMGYGNIPQQFGSGIQPNMMGGPQNMPQIPFQEGYNPNAPRYSFPTNPSPVQDEMDAATSLIRAPKKGELTGEAMQANQQIIGAPDTASAAGDTGAGSMGDMSGFISSASDIMSGAQALGQEKKQAKTAKTWRKVSDISLKAFNTPDVNERQTIADTAKRTRKALMPVVNAETLFPAYGVGTNVLAKDGGKLPTGGLSRGSDFGSKSKPYPGVSKGDFAGGGRSYPIPTIEDAGDALRLAGLHHRPDVKAKVYAKYPELRKGQDGEIMNTYAPNDIYQDGGYEPLGESIMTAESEPGFQPLSDVDIVKAFRAGGLIPVAQGGSSFMGGGQGFPWQSFANSAESITSNVQGNNAGNQIGGGIGSAVGSYFGPLGSAVGKFAGSAIGGALDPYSQRIKKDQEIMMGNIGKMSGISNTKNFLGGFGGVAEDGGYMSHDWQPQVITKFNDVNMSDIPHMFDDMRTLRTGGNIRQNQVGDIEAVSGGHLEPMSYNPYADGSGMTSMIKGQSHGESNGKHTGVLLNYKKQDGGDMGGEPQVEAERGEPIKEIGDNAVIFGDIKIGNHTTGSDPDFTKFHGKTFKKAMAEIAKDDKKLNTQQHKNNKAIAELEPITPIDKIKMNSLMLNEKGIDQKYLKNQAITQKASQYQDMFNQEAEARGLDAGALSRGKSAPNINLPTAKKGKKIAPEDINPPRGAKGNVNPNQPYSYTAQTPGALDYTPVGAGNQEMFASPEAYAKYKAETEAAYADPELAEQLVNYFKNYEGPDWQDVRGAVNKGKTFEEQRQIAQRLATDYKPGRFHINTSQFKKTPVPPETPGEPEQGSTYDVTPYQKSGWETLAGQILPWMRKVPGEELQGNQLAGEMFALGQNRIEPVQARFYHPELDVPYDISYQDQLNKNQADFNQLTRVAGNNPEALAALAAQKYGANTSVLGEQFRANQAMKDRVYSGNRATLNQAQLQNLGIADQQYTRQEQAKSRTKETAQEALNSIASKIGQNRLENRTLQTYSNMFPDYSFDAAFRARHTGAPAEFDISQGIYSPTGEVTHVPIRDENGDITGYQKIVGGKTTSKVPPTPLVPGKTKTTTKTTKTSGTGKVENTKTETSRHGNLVRAFKML